MKKIALGLMLAVMSACALANWEEVASSEEGKFKYYADAATIQKAGALVKVSTLIDYQEVQPISGDKQYLSVKMLEEINCAEQKTRHLNLAAFSEHMGTGKVVGSEKKPADWRPVSPESMVQDILTFACSKN